MSVKRIFLTSVIFLILTILTQVGGIIYLLSGVCCNLIEKHTGVVRLKSWHRLIVFSICYCIATFIIVPVIAKPFGRERLPLVAESNLQPLNFITSLLNRNYVRPELKQAAYD